MAYLQLGVDPARADDAIDKTYVDSGTSSLLSTATWETWLTDDWNTVLGWFASPTIGTTTQTSFWTTIINDVVNPLNAIETQANNVIVSITHDLTDIFDGIFGTTTPTNTTKVSAAAVTNVLGGADMGDDLSSLGTSLYGSPTVGSTVQVSAIPTGIPQNNISGLVTSLASFLGTTTFQALLDGIANVMGHSGTGHTTTQVETYLGLIPPANVVSTLGTTSLATDVQAILDNIANALGHSGTGHTLANILTYLGLIPAANVTAVLGGANLGADVSAVFAGLSAYLTTGSFQSLLDAIANALGQTGTGHTITQVETYLGLIPSTNVAGTFPQSQITGLATALSNLLGTSVFQSLLDGIANVMGHSGTGHTVTQVETYLGLIPPANVTNVLGGSSLGADMTTLSTALYGGTTVGSTVQVSAIPSGIPQNSISGLVTSLSSLLGTTTFQSLLDGIANALGQSGTGHTVTQVETYLGIIPPTNVTNVLGGGSLGADVQSILDFIANGLGHSGTGHTLTNIETYLGLIPAANVSGTFPQSQITGLATALSNLLGTTTFQALLDGISNALGYTGTGHTITQVETYLGLIPPTNVTGIGGATSLATATQSIMDYLTQAFSGTATTGNSFGQLANAAASTANTASAAQMVAQAATLVQAQQTAAKAAWNAFGDVTADVTFPVGPTYSLASMPTISVTSSTSAIGYIATPDNVNKLAVMFVAEIVGTVTGAYINVYSVGAAGLCTKVIAGSNIVSEIGNLEAVIYDDFASALTVTPGDTWAIEVIITGSGSLTMMGLSSSWAPTNSLVAAGAVGGSRFTTITPTFDAVGAGTYTAAAAISPFSWLHTIGTTSPGVLIEFAMTGTPTTVKVGGVSATLVASKLVSTGITAYMYELSGGSVPTGSQTVAITFSGSEFLVGNSVSYLNVSSFGTAVTNAGSAGTASLSVTSAPGQLAVVTIIDNGTTGISAFNKTSRWNNGASTSFFGLGGDATGAATVNFTATAGSAWAAIGVSIVGPAAGVPTSFTPTASTLVPLFGLSANGGTTVAVFAPETADYTVNGTYTYTLPTWFKLGVDYLDTILLGPGGGGGGGIPNPGSAGGTTSVTVDGTTITAAGGSGGASGNTTSTGAIGASPGTQIYNSQPYYGGSQSAYGYGLNTVGSSPGGGGAGGGTSGTYGFGGSAGAWTTHTFNPTGTTVSVTVGAGGAGSPFFGAENGADGAVWLVARQV